MAASASRAIYKSNTRPGRQHSRQSLGTAQGKARCSVSKQMLPAADIQKSPISPNSAQCAVVMGSPPQPRNLLILKISLLDWRHLTPPSPHSGDIHAQLPGTLALLLPT